MVRRPGTPAARSMLAPGPLERRGHVRLKLVEPGLWLGYSGQHRAFQRGDGVNFAIVLRERGELCGSIGLLINARDANAALGYWIGLPYWSRGYATEAAREVVRYGFERLGLHRIYAAHFGNNPASGRVLRKIGMAYEGTRREHHRKWGEYEDRVEYGLLVSEWQAAQRSAGSML